MANYSELIATINEQIKANGNQEITGPVLNAVLQAMVSALGEGYQFMGMATPDTDPGTPDGKVFYLATEGGTYVNFPGIGFDDGMLVYIYTDVNMSGGWNVRRIINLDNSPDGSTYFGGLADEDTIPNTKLFYILTKAGDYSNFSLVLDYDGIYIVTYVASSWRADSIYLNNAGNCNEAVMFSNPGSSSAYSQKCALGKNYSISNIGDYIEVTFRGCDFTVPNRLWANNTYGTYLECTENEVVIADIHSHKSDKFKVPSLKKWSRLRYTKIASNVSKLEVNGEFIGTTTVGSRVASPQIDTIVSQYTQNKYQYMIHEVIINISGEITKYDAKDLYGLCNRQNPENLAMIPYDSSSVYIEEDLVADNQLQNSGILKNVERQSLETSPVILPQGYDFEILGYPTVIKSGNRFKKESISTSMSSYNSSFQNTVENYGVKIVRPALEEVKEYGWQYAVESYTAEYSGKLFVQLDAYGEDITDVGVRIYHNGNAGQLMRGNGHYTFELEVESGDSVSIRLYGIMAQSNWLKSNTITYSKIMFQYEALTDFYENEDGVVNKRNIYPSCILEGDNFKVNFFGIKNKSETCVCFGDSITGMYTEGTGYPEVANRANNSINIVGVGFPGNTLTLHNPDQGISQDAYNAFSFINIVDAIVTNDYSVQQNALSNIPESNRPYYEQALNRLKNIDFSKVAFVTLLYGTNDWSSSRIVSHGDSTTKDNCIEDAFDYCVTTLLSKFPQINIIVLTPLWRTIPELDVVDSNTDVINGVLLPDVCDAIMSWAKNKYNLTTYDLYRIGINVTTQIYYLNDGVHPGVRGVNMIASVLNSILAEKQQL